jgi:hypothetical protein
VKFLDSIEQGIDYQKFIVLKRHSIMAAKAKDQEFLEYLVKSIVDNPDAVKVDRAVDEMGVLLTLKVDPQDLGKVIGRRGNTARAIRNLLRVVGVKNQARVNLKIEEPAKSSSTSASAASKASVEEVVDDLKI